MPESLNITVGQCFIIHSTDLPVLLFCRSGVQLADNHGKAKLLYDAVGVSESSHYSTALHTFQGHQHWPRGKAECQFTLLSKDRGHELKISDIFLSAKQNCLKV